MEEVAKKGDECPVSGNIPGQIGQGFEKSDFVEDVHPHWRGLGLDDL